MFFKRKKNKTRIVTFKFNHGSISGSSQADLKNDEALFEYLKDMYEKFGPILITEMADWDKPYMRITTKDSLKHDTKEKRDLEIEGKIEDIHQLISNFIHDKRIHLEQHVLISKGKLIGVFSKKELAEDKKERLIKQGHSSEDIKITPITLDSVIDFSRVKE